MENIRNTLFQYIDLKLFGMLFRLFFLTIVIDFIFNIEVSGQKRVLTISSSGEKEIIYEFAPTEFHNRVVHYLQNPSSAILVADTLKFIDSLLKYFSEYPYPIMVPTCFFEFMRDTSYHRRLIADSKWSDLNSQRVNICRHYSQYYADYFVLFYIDFSLLKRRHVGSFFDLSIVERNGKRVKGNVCGRYKCYEYAKMKKLYKLYTDWFWENRGYSLLEIRSNEIYPLSGTKYEWFIK